MFSCTALTCNCAISELNGAEHYWTANENPDNPARAFSVWAFNYQVDLDGIKSQSMVVIGVRGGRQSD
jgi:hypothetical protein